MVIRSIEVAERINDPISTPQIEVKIKLNPKAFNVIVMRYLLVEEIGQKNIAVFPSWESNRTRVGNTKMRDGIIPRLPEKA